MSRRYPTRVPPSTPHPQENPDASPGRKARVQGALRDRRFVVHALPFTTHTESLGPEDLVRGLTHASRTALFWWIGPDGSRLLTMYSAGGYGTDLVPRPDRPHRTWLALIHTGDNHGPPRPDEIRKLLDRARETLPGVASDDFGAPDRLDIAPGETEAV